MICNDIVETSTGTRNDLYVPSRLCSIVPHDSIFCPILISKGGNCNHLHNYCRRYYMYFLVQDESKNELFFIRKSNPSFSLNFPIAAIIHPPPPKTHPYLQMIKRDPT